MGPIVVGWAEGDEVGLTEGEDVGDVLITVGFSEGLDVEGLRVGDPVDSVGETVDFVGLMVGLRVGATVLGFLVGCVVGATVLGFLVG